MSAKTKARAVPQRRSRKRSRLEVRLTDAQKRLLQSAADVRDETLTEFVMRVSETAARKELEESGIIVLTRQQQEKFVNALLNPPKPNARLERAAERYRRMTGHRSRK
jgi:uncharacterized protein (DUF1778 family)